VLPSTLGAFFRYPNCTCNYMIEINLRMPAPNVRAHAHCCDNAIAFTSLPSPKFDLAQGEFSTGELIFKSAIDPPIEIICKVRSCWSARTLT
jgi:hypothetical protein